MKGLLESLNDSKSLPPRGAIGNKETWLKTQILDKRG
jgi:hypothetical protein